MDDSRAGRPANLDVSIGRIRLDFLGQVLTVGPRSWSAPPARPRTRPSSRGPFRIAALRARTPVKISTSPGSSSDSSRFSSASSGAMLQLRAFLNLRAVEVICSALSAASPTSVALFSTQSIAASADGRSIRFRLFTSFRRRPWPLRPRVAARPPATASRAAPVAVAGPFSLSSGDPPEFELGRLDWVALRPCFALDLLDLLEERASFFRSGLRALLTGFAFAAGFGFAFAFAFAFGFGFGLSHA